MTILRESARLYRRIASERKTNECCELILLCLASANMLHPEHIRLIAQPKVWRGKAGFKLQWKAILHALKVIRNPESLPSTCRLGKLQRRANIHRYAIFTRKNTLYFLTLLLIHHNHVFI